MRIAINEDVYRKRYKLSARQFDDEPLDDILMGLKIIEYENIRREKENRRANQSSQLPPS